MGVWGMHDGEELLKLVEINVGRRKPRAICIVDSDFNLRAAKGEIEDDVLRMFRKFPLSEMQIGDIVQNQNAFLMKVTDMMGVIVKMGEPHYTGLAAVNLKSRINALDGFYKLERKLELERIRKALLEAKEMAPDDIIASALIRRDGLVVASTLPEGISRMFAMSVMTTLGAGSKAMEMLKRGELKRIFIEGEQGEVILSSIGSFILIVLARKEANLALVLLSIERTIEVLEKYVYSLG